MRGTGKRVVFYGLMIITLFLFSSACGELSTNLRIRTTMNPKNRTLIRVNIEDAEKADAEAEAEEKADETATEDAAAEEANSADVDA